MILLLGVAAVGLTIWQGVIPAFYSPDIEVSGSDPASPFVFPFSVTNESWLFSMTNIEKDCLIQHMEVPRTVLDDINVVQQNLPDMKPNGYQNYYCNVMNPGVPIISLTMDVTFRFETFYFWHRHETQRFTWIVDGTHSKWIKGGT